MAQAPSALVRTMIQNLKSDPRIKISSLISQGSGCTDSSTTLSQADLVEEIATSDGKIVKITGVPKPCKTASILCRGSNKMVRCCAPLKTFIFHVFNAVVMHRYTDE